MTIEEIKAKLAELRPKVAAAWEEYQRRIQDTVPARDVWFELRQELNELEKEAVELATK